VLFNNLVENGIYNLHFEIFRFPRYVQYLQYLNVKVGDYAVSSRCF